MRCTVNSPSSVSASAVMTSEYGFRPFWPARLDDWLSAPPVRVTVGAVVWAELAQPATNIRAAAKATARNELGIGSSFDEYTSSRIGNVRTFVFMISPPLFLSAGPALFQYVAVIRPRDSYQGAGIRDIPARHMS